MSNAKVFSLLTAIVAASAPAQADDWYQAADNANARIKNYEQTLATGNKAAIREATMALQSDPMAVRLVNQNQSDGFKTKLNENINEVRAEARQLITKELNRRGISSDKIKIFEATNPKKPGNPVEVGQDWDVTVRVNGRDVPARYSQSIVDEAFYQAATGQKPPSPEAAHHFAEHQAVAVTDYQHPEAYGGSVKEGDAIISGPKGQRLRDPTQISQVIEFKSNEAANKAKQLREAGNVGDAVGMESEAIRQSVKQFKKQVRERVVAAGGTIPEHIENAQRILEKGTIPIRNGGLTPEEVRAQLQRIGETPQSAISKSASLVESVQVLARQNMRGKAPNDVFVENVQGRLASRGFDPNNVRKPQGNRSGKQPLTEGRSSNDPRRRGTTPETVPVEAPGGAPVESKPPTEGPPTGGSGPRNGTENPSPPEGPSTGAEGPTSGAQNPAPSEVPAAGASSEPRGTQGTSPTEAPATGATREPGAPTDRPAAGQPTEAPTGGSPREGGTTTAATEQRAGGSPREGGTTTPTELPPSGTPGEPPSNPGGSTPATTESPVAGAPREPILAPGTTPPVEVQRPAPTSEPGGSGPVAAPEGPGSRVIDEPQTGGSTAPTEGVGSSGGAAGTARSTLSGALSAISTAAPGFDAAGVELTNSMRTGEEPNPAAAGLNAAVEATGIPNIVRGIQHGAAIRDKHVAEAERIHGPGLNAELTGRANALRQYAGEVTGITLGTQLGEEEVRNEIERAAREHREPSFTRSTVKAMVRGVGEILMINTIANAANSTSEQEAASSGQEKLLRAWAQSKRLEYIKHLREVGLEIATLLVEGNSSDPGYAGHANTLIEDYNNTLNALNRLREAMTRQFGPDDPLVKFLAQTIAELPAAPTSYPTDPPHDPAPSVASAPAQVPAKTPAAINPTPAPSSHPVHTTIRTLKPGEGFGSSAPATQASTPKPIKPPVQLSAKPPAKAPVGVKPPAKSPADSEWDLFRQMITDDVRSTTTSNVHASAANGNNQDYHARASVLNIKARNDHYQQAAQQLTQQLAHNAAVEEYNRRAYAYAYANWLQAQQQQQQQQAYATAYSGGGYSGGGYSGGGHMGGGGHMDGGGDSTGASIAHLINGIISEVTGN